VDRLSSAHVYMRLSKGETVANISKEARGLWSVALAACARALTVPHAPARRSWRTAVSW
jgi:hypothetical protein